MINDDIEIGKLLSRLFGKACTSTTDRPKKFPIKDAELFGKFVDDDDNLVGIVATDRAFACNTGAALMMLPPAAASDAKGEKELPENISAPFGEVLNVLSRMFNTSTRPHCRYTDMIEGKANDEIKGFVKAASHGKRYIVEVQGYGRGLVSLFMP